jgi:hypothetical protein
MITIGKIDLDGVRDELKSLKASSIANATKRAILRTGQGTAARIAKTVREKNFTSAPAARLKTLTNISKRFQATPPEATVHLLESPIPARYFFPVLVKTKWRTGVQVRILGKQYVGGFPLDVAKGKIIGGGNMRATKRIGPSTQIMKRQKKNGQKRDQLTKFYATSLADIMKYGQLEGDTRDYIAKRLSKELAHELTRAAKA